jgi:anti-sigma B factor antagonist
MQVKIDKQVKKDVVVLRLSGDLLGGTDAELFHNTIKQIIAGGNTKVLADMGKVYIVNSTGLGILIAALTSMKNAGGALKLLNVTKRIESLLMVTKLSLIFDTFQEEEKALASFA